MGIADDIKHAAEDLAGKAKEATGKLTGNDKLEAEGKTEQVTSDVKKTGTDIKDAVTGDK
ncbi:CsbD family protein [Microbacterium sp. SORGH_AS_0888]|uniref:CsbD family protein n=1 Tax=Microbacterium sp. SORGH_AS_0888 TaxID=3041791 RepID=UPI00278658D3|nr:CsbD family protein [Microbacterium sp. SORGH_AS_0888]MDQ1131198.1 uncharacterized protein YjbJ (UPF0337 family) [Microbacterium sp. SORGH_AS_0888]